MKIIIGKGQFMGPVSGADETLVAYATQLGSAGHSVSVLLMYPHMPGDQYYLGLSKAGVPVFSIAPASVRAYLDAGRNLSRGLLQVFPKTRHILRRRAQRLASSVADQYFGQCCVYLRKLNADLLHVITPDPSAMIMIRAANAVGLPVFYQELGIPYHPPEFKSYYKEFTSVLPLCSEVAALSPKLALQCREKLPHANSLSVLPIMASASFHQVTASSKAAPTQPNVGVTFGFAARFEYLKAPQVLLEAFAKVFRERNDVRLKLVGVGSLRRKIIARAAALGVAHACDFPPVYKRPEEKGAFMQSLNVFVLPSLTEGTPNSIMEAMAYGLPVISTTVGGIPDVVTAETGILVPSEDTEALAGAMLRLAADPALRTRMGEAAKSRYEELFSPDSVLPVIMNRYRAVISGMNNHGRGDQPEGNELSHPWANTYF
ncbi:MAG TPA: glycosyltransferase family 4 protein [Pyrinomonadaceae bacterium]